MRLGLSSKRHDCRVERRHVAALVDHKPRAPLVPFQRLFQQPADMSIMNSLWAKTSLAGFADVSLPQPETTVAVPPLTMKRSYCRSAWRESTFARASRTLLGVRGERRELRIGQGNARRRSDVSTTTT